MCAETSSLTLIDAAGLQHRLQRRTIDRWSDGSVRWVLLDFRADTGDDSRAQYEIVVDGDAEDTLTGPRVAVTRAAERCCVDTGPARFFMRPHGRFPFDEVTMNGGPAIEPDSTGLSIEDGSGELLTVSIDTVDVEEEGPLRSVLRCRGTVRGRRRGRPRLELTARLHFFAGSAAVRFSLTLRNPRRAHHRGGCWTLGDRGSVYLRDVSLRITMAAQGDAPVLTCSPEVGAPHDRCLVPFELYQDSSGGERWQSANHENRDRQVTNSFQGYRVRSNGVERQGRRATPAVSMACGDGRLTVAMRHFWQNFPKAIDADGRSLTLRLFPRQYADIHEIQGGEQKTHTFGVAFDRDGVTSGPLDWCRAPLLARADPSWYCAAAAVPYLVPFAEDTDAEHVDMVRAAIEGGDTFERKREVIDEYGWRHFGDIYADHEAVFERGTAPLISHYNNQYDAVAGFAYQFLRSADPRWWTLMEELAAHVADIDTYHTDSDKSAYNHGLFWHTCHYIDAGAAGHRSFPRHPKVGGGGPSAEHNYTTGLLLHYFLTGDPLSRETAIELAQWVVNMDDGRATVFRWLDRGATGLASATGSPLYHGPGRGAANSIVALINGHRLTGDAAFLAKAEHLIRRCVHPADDLDDRNLLDAERRWSYTVFLQAIGTYLDDKAERGLRDERYAYARASLLHYAAWMADHEYPYLDRPEILEYPTETWAAQDLRKSDALAFAAKHSSGHARARLLERSDYFFHHAISTLSTMPTRTLTRPVTLMLTNGLMHAGLARDRDVAAATPSFTLPPDVASPERFIPQKVRAIARARLIAAATGAVAAVATIYLVFRAL